MSDLFIVLACLTFIIIINIEKYEYLVIPLILTLACIYWMIIEWIR